MISYFQITGSGVNPDNVAEFIQKMTSLLTSQGYRVYSGDPSLNGCPFDFSAFEYRPEPSSKFPEMFLVIMNDYDDMCLVLCSGGKLTPLGFTGSTSVQEMAILYKEPADTLQIIKSGNASFESAGYSITTNRGMAVVFGTQDYSSKAMYIGSNVWGCLSGTDTIFLAHAMIPIPIPNTVPSDPHTLVVNKPQGEYGLAMIGFPKNDVVNVGGTYNRQYLIQDITYYVISAPDDTKRYCIY